MNVIQTITVWALPVLFAVTLHEVAHGWVARLFGDSTAAKSGRLSLNPLRHVDPVGTILIPAVMILLPGNFIFGWAKPVPVNAMQLGNPRRDMAIVAAAGPASNFVMAFFWAIIMRSCLASTGSDSGYAEFFVYMGAAGVVINLMLMILNLLPIPPLDGGRVLAGVVPDNFSYVLRKIEPYGFFILIGLLVLGMLGKLIFTPFIIALSFILYSCGVQMEEFLPYLYQLVGQSD